MMFSNRRLSIRATSIEFDSCNILRMIVEQTACEAATQDTEAEL
jgi:hypothetical protein